jgi:type III secretion protein N (ATPase)
MPDTDAPLRETRPPHEAWSEQLSAALRRAAAGVPRFEEVGVVHEAVGTVLKARGVEACVGEICQLSDPASGSRMLAEVVGFSGPSAILMPFGEITGVSTATEVRSTGLRHMVPAGDALLGRVLDGFGHPLDGKPLAPTSWRPGRAPAPPALARQRVARPFATGVRGIDALCTLGQGQRIGIFAPAGVGKSTLLGMLARRARCDVRVVALIGERGREVREFLDLNLGDELAGSVVVVATSDRSPVERFNAAHTATAIAEHFRDAGRSVLLLVDSVTRFARAQREIGLAAGEPPARQGFPPSVFSALPQLMERGGCGAVGSITAFYTVLAEGEVGTDPVADEVRATLDGHLVLSPKIAQRGQFPAIDMLQSLSRLMPLMADPAHQAAARRLRALLHKYDEIEMLVQLGEYRARSDPDADEALARMPEIRRFLAQRTDEATPADEAIAQLMRLVGAVQ